MKLVFLCLLVVFIGLVKSQQPTQLLAFKGPLPGPDMKYEFSITDLETGEVIKQNNVSAIDVFIMGTVGQVQGNVIQLLGSNITSDLNLYLFEYDYVSNEMTVLSYVAYENYFFLFQPLTYNPVANSIFIAGGVGQGNPNVTILSLDFETHEMYDTQLDVQYMKFGPPLGAYDMEGDSMYISFYDQESLGQTLIKYSFQEKAIVSSFNISSIIDDYFMIFMANSQLYSVQIGLPIMTSIKLYTIDLVSGDKDLVFSLPNTYSIISDAYYTFNDDYIVFLSTPVDNSTLTYTTVSLSNYTIVSESTTNTPLQLASIIAIV